MRWYKGVQADDPKPIGGGSYTEVALGNEAFNFLPAGNCYLGYFQPQLQPRERRKANPSSIHLEKIQPGFRCPRLFFFASRVRPSTPPLSHSVLRPSWRRKGSDAQPMESKRGRTGTTNGSRAIRMQIAQRVSTY
jgi:hypothetical protein